MNETSATDSPSIDGELEDQDISEVTGNLHIGGNLQVNGSTYSFGGLSVAGELSIGSKIMFPDSTVQSTAVHVESGAYGYGVGSKGDGVWNLGSGTGDRRFRKTIHFKKPFVTIPHVQIGLTYFDLRDIDTNERLAIYARNIMLDRFDIEFRTWNKAAVYRAAASWLAIGA